MAYSREQIAYTAKKMEEAGESEDTIRRFVQGAQNQMEPEPPKKEPKPEGKGFWGTAGDIAGNIGSTIGEMAKHPVAGISRGVPMAVDEMAKGATNLLKSGMNAVGLKDVQENTSVPYRKEVDRTAGLTEEQKKAAGGYSFATKQAVGLAATPIVPGAGVGAGAGIKALSLLGKGAVANLPFANNVGDMALNTAIDLTLLGAGKIPGVSRSAKSAVVSTFEKLFPSADKKALDDAGQIVVDKINNMIDKEKGTLSVPGGKKYLLREVDKDVIADVTSEINKSVDFKFVLEKLGEPLPQFRRDIGELSPKGLKNQMKGKSAELLQQGGESIDITKPEGLGLAGFGRRIEERQLKELSNPKAETTTDFGKHLNAARAHIVNRSVKSPFEIAGESAGKAFADIDEIAQKLAADKEAVLKRNPDLTVNLDPLYDEWQTAVKNVLGAEIVVNKSKGKLVAKLVNDKGRVIVDPEAVQPIQDITELLLQKNGEISVKMADDIKRRIQRMSYNSSTGRDNGIAKRLGRQISGVVDRKLDEVLGDDYRIANEKLRDVINLEDMLSKRMGKPVNYESGLRQHGASVMKRSQQSSADAGIKELFRQVKTITNGKYDLMQEAAYAEAAMKAVNDPQAYSLLEEVGGIRDANQFGIGGKAGMVLGAAQKVGSGVGRAASGFKDDGDLLLDYYQKAQKKNSKTGIIGELENIIGMQGGYGAGSGALNRAGLGGAAGYVMPADSDEERRRNAMIGAGGAAGLPVVAKAFGRKMAGTPGSGEIALNSQVKSDNFKRWFGDWEKAPEQASKVVDGSGKPLVVYHGAPDKNEIMKDGTFKSQYERFGMGKKTGVHWFTDDMSTAKTYADPWRASDYQSAEPGIINTYLDIRNPMVIDGEFKNWRDVQKMGKTTNAIDEAVKKGHDGIIIENVYDTYNTNPGDATKSKRKARPVTTYAVFSSNQIKSATGNSGAFNPNDPNITKALVGGAGGLSAMAAMSSNKKKKKD